MNTSFLVGTALLFSLFKGVADSGYEVPTVQVIEVLEQEPAQEIEEEETEDYVYTIANVNIRFEANAQSEILITAEVGTKLLRTGIDVEDGWDTVVINDETYYIANDFITTEKLEEIEKVDSIEDQITDFNVRYLSAIVFAEAGNQPYAGQLAVAIVVMNRSASEDFADGVYNVIYQSGQFTPTTNGTLDKALSLYDAGEIPESCIEAAMDALQGVKAVTYNGNVYDLSDCVFFSRYVYNAKYVIGDHMFK